MTSTRRTKNCSEMDLLRKELENVKIQLAEHRTSQIHLNSQFLNHLQDWQSQQHLLRKIPSYLRLFNERYKKQKVELDLVTRLLGGKLQNSLSCECGRKVDLFQGSTGVETPCADKSQTQPERQQKKSDSDPREEKEKSIQSNISTHKDGDMESQTERSIQTDLIVKKKFSYSPELRKFIGRPHPECTRPGPVLSLDENGSCIFEVEYRPNLSPMKIWKRFFSDSSNNQYLISKFILLPDEWKGMIIQFQIQILNGEELEFAANAFDMPHNRLVNLPQSFGLQVQVKLLDGDVYASYIQPYIINRLCTTFPNNPSYLRLPLDLFGPELFPELTLRFIKSSHC